MYKLYFRSLFIFGVLIFTNCDEPKDEDTTPPIVTIISPQDGSTVSGVVSIVCESEDNEGVQRVELWIDRDSTGISDDTQPFSLEWNTYTYTDSTVYTIMVKSYDINKNITESVPITLFVNNSDFYPTPVFLYPVIFDGGSFRIKWSQNFDEDFISYCVLESDFIDMREYEIPFCVSHRSIDTTYQRYYLYGTGFEWFYQVVVENEAGLESKSNIQRGYSPGYFVKTFGGDGNDIGYSVQETNDEGFIILGSTSPYGSSDSDIILIKLNRFGHEEWSNTYGISLYDWGICVQQVLDGGFIFTGGISNGGSHEDVLLIKTDSQGNEEWYRTFSMNQWDRGYSVKQTSDGGLIIIGITYFGNGDSDAWLIKTDPQGNEEWNRTFGGDYDDRGYSVQLTNDNGYIISGYSRSFGSPDSTMWLIKTDSQGNEEWSRTYGAPRPGGGYSVIQTEDGYILLGNKILLKTDELGNEEWTQVLEDYSNDEKGDTFHQTQDGGFVLTGQVLLNDVNYTTDLVLLKTDNWGNEEWRKTLGGDHDDRGISVRQTSDGGYIITGTTKSFGSGSKDIWVIKTDAEGNTEPYGE